MVSLCRLAFSALTLLVGRQEGHLARKNRVVRCWRGFCLEQGAIIGKHNTLTHIRLMALCPGLPG